MRLLYSFLALLLPSCLLCDTQPLPLCSEKCTCTYVDNSDAAKVTCVKNVKDLLVTRSTWINPQTNQSYPYTEITLTNQNFMELNITFPDSDLTYLNLAQNDIYGIRDSVFQDLQSMKVLILSNNDLELLSPNAFKGYYLEGRLEPLRSLVELRLDHNRLHTLHQDIFEHTTDLEILDLSYNPLKVLDPHTTIAIDSLTNLKELYLSYTQLSSLPDYIFHTPAHLSILGLSGNPFKTIPGALGDCHNLSTLYLDDTGFVNLTKENGFPEVPTIKVLHLSNLADLERIESEALAGLTGLEEVHITNNIKLKHLNTFAMAKINTNGGAIWSPIRKLYLQNNKLSYLDSDVIARWDSLTELDIRDNPWTCECENQWMVEDLMQYNVKIDPKGAAQVRCGAPIEMVKYSLLELYESNYKMRCLDAYGAQPDKDATLLIGVLAGVLLAIPAILLVIFAFQRRWFAILSDNSPAAYSRRFYAATKEDDF